MYPKPFMPKVLKQQCLPQKHKEPLYLISSKQKVLRQTMRNNYLWMICNRYKLAVKLINFIYPEGK